MDDKNTIEMPPGEPQGSAPAEPLQPEVQLTHEQVAELQARAAKAEESWDRYVRAVAELDNYRKRATREKGEAVQFANESLMQKLLPVLDNFDMALAAAADPSTTVESLRTGVTMIQGQLRQALTDAGLEEVLALGAVFDPNHHEAVAQLPSNEVPEGHVLQQLRKGYRLKGRLLRPTSVVVAAAPSA